MSSDIITLPAKQCSRCKEVKLLTEFGKDPKNKSGLKSGCRSCDCKYSEKQRIKNSEILPQIRKEYNRSNKKSIKVKQQKKREEDDLYYIRKRLKSRYGITYEEFLGMMERDENKCQICGVTNEEYNQLYNKNLSIDHCHNTKYLRGILCDKCNTGIGQFKDNTDLLNKAINYLFTWKGKIA